MRIRSSLAPFLVLLPSLALAACTTKEPDPTASQSPRARQKQEPQTPQDYLDLAEEAMAADPGWRFQVRGQEKLTLQGQQNEAIYSAMMERTQDPMALHARGTVSTSKGTRGEELFVLDDTGYLIREGSGEWKQRPAADPEIANKVEDPVTALADFSGYTKRATGVDITLTKVAYGTQVRLRADVTSRRLADVRDRPWGGESPAESGADPGPTTRSWGPGE